MEALTATPRREKMTVDRATPWRGNEPSGSGVLFGLSKPARSKWIGMRRGIWPSKI